MPEGHTIHALAARLERAFGGHPVAASSPQGRFTADARRIDGLVLDAAVAIGKHLFVELGPETLHVHLGLIGTFHVKPTEGALPSALPTVRLRLAGNGHVADLRGPMTCTLVDETRRSEIIGRLGPDPLDPRADGSAAYGRARRSRRAIAELLMDQSVVSGVGNVYRCEVLHRLAIDPFTRGTDLSETAWNAIWDDLVVLLPLGVAFSQILTMQDQVEEAAEMVGDGSARPVTASLTGERLGDHFERRFHVYKRTGESCDRCRNTLCEKGIGGRRLYWCPACQVLR